MRGIAFVTQFEENCFVVILYLSVLTPWTSVWLDTANRKRSNCSTVSCRPTIPFFFLTSNGSKSMNSLGWGTERLYIEVEFNTRIAHRFLFNYARLKLSRIVSIFRRSGDRPPFAVWNNQSLLKWSMEYNLKIANFEILRISDVSWHQTLSIWQSLHVHVSPRVATVFLDEWLVYLRKVHTGECYKQSGKQLAFFTSNNWNSVIKPPARERGQMCCLAEQSGL